MEEGGAKVRFKCQGCREAKKLAEHWSRVSLEPNKFKNEFFLFSSSY